MEVKYSFIVPVYNVEKYMKYCIESLVAQTYKAFEIIIVDDGSTDKCGQIADEYRKRYSECVRVIHQANTGQGGARNHGIELAKGKYMLFVDGDDYVSPRMLEIIDQYLKNYDDDILFFEWQSVKEDEIGCQKDIHFFDIHDAMSKAEYVYQQPSPWRKVYKASLFRDKDLRFPDRIYYEDMALAPCFVLEAEKIGVIKEKLYYYVQRGNSTMRSKDISRLLEIMPAFDYAIKIFKKNELFEKYYGELEWMAIQHVLYFSACRISMVGYFPEDVQKLYNYMNENFPSYKENPYRATGDEYIKPGELETLLDVDYKMFDRRYFYWFRKKRWIKDNLKKFFEQIDENIGACQCALRRASNPVGGNPTK